MFAIVVIVALVVGQCSGGTGWRRLIGCRSFPAKEPLIIGLFCGIIGLFCGK